MTVNGRRTIKTELRRVAAERDRATFFRYKQDGVWRTLSYRDLLLNSRRAAEVIHCAGVRPGDRVAMVLDNGVEWPAVYLGIVSVGAVAVPMDPKLGDEEAAHVLRHSGAVLAIVMDTAPERLARMADRLPDLKRVAVVGDCESSPAASPHTPWSTVGWEAACREADRSAMSEGAAFDRFDPDESDAASIIYTSGTTGRPKGAVLTHANFLSNANACLEVFAVRQDDNFLLALPLHHAFAFTANFLLPLCRGAEVSLAETIRAMGESIVQTRPSIVIGVPLLLDKMLAKIEANVAGNRVARTLVRIGLARIVGRGIRRKMGGRLRVLISGGAPCAPETILGWSKFGFCVREGYGLTETSPVVSINPETRPRPGTVGLPLPGVEVDLRDRSEEGVGEIVVRGPNVMQGYYRNPEGTAEAIPDGWFHTGDLGRIDGEGYLVICGRKKSLIVNREGKNIHPEEVEARILRSPYILEAIVAGYRPVGESVGEWVGAMVVPDCEAIEARCTSSGRSLAAFDVPAFIRDEVKQACAGLTGYKRPRRIDVRMEPFEKTPTQKVKRYLYKLDSADSGDVTS